MAFRQVNHPITPSPSYLSLSLSRSLCPSPSPSPSDALLQLLCSAYSLSCLYIFLFFCSCRLFAFVYILCRRRYHCPSPSVPPTLPVVLGGGSDAKPCEISKVLIDKVPSVASLDGLCPLAEFQ